MSDRFHRNTHLAYSFDQLSKNPIQPRDWEQAFKMLAQAVDGRRAIIILGELPYTLRTNCKAAA
jgi:hypothetical protein